ncbi:MAG: hypothetical protein HC895_08660 [Leptolyngbyaceae cyanobacterium SM1_3_5]|nr:hypothetical protein [Leptolyngbyaceae cyanobacterium SM1_3_5]
MLYWKFLANQFDRLWQAFVRFAETTQEPKVTWRRDRWGRSYLEIYDFSTKKHYRFDSEQDARIWLDRDRFQQTETQKELLEKNLRNLKRL